MCIRYLKKYLKSLFYFNPRSFFFFLSCSSENPCDNKDTITIETQNEDGAILDSEEETTTLNETISVHEKANENKSTSDTLVPPQKN